MNQIKNASVLTYIPVCCTYTVWSSFFHGKPKINTIHVHGAWSDESAQHAKINTNEPNKKRYCSHVSCLLDIYSTIIFSSRKTKKKTTIHGAWYDENAQRAIANTNEPNGKRFCMFARIYPRLLYRYGMIIFPSRKTKKKLYHSRSLKWWKQLARKKQIKNLTACTYRVYCIWSFLPGRPENNTLQLGAWHDENAWRDENASHDENQHERTK
jgi:hypothetical protein